MTANSLLKKLQLKGDQRAVIINPPLERCTEGLSRDTLKT